MFRFLPDNPTPELLAEWTMVAQKQQAEIDWQAAEKKAAAEAERLRLQAQGKACPECGRTEVVNTGHTWGKYDWQFSCDEYDTEIQYCPFCGVRLPT